MTGTGTAARPRDSVHRLRRVVLVLAVLAGVLTMHGLTSGHGVCSLPAGGHHGTGSAAADVRDHGHAAAAGPLAALPTGLSDAACGHGGDDCVAVLTLLLLLLPAAGLLEHCRRRRWSAPPGLARVVAGWLRGPPPDRAPSLFVLCQLRT